MHTRLSAASTILRVVTLSFSFKIIWLFAFFEDFARFPAASLPRIPGLPHTAPRYDELTKPVTVPTIAGCVQIGKRCQCYTDRGTRYAASRDICLEVVAGNTPFYDFKQDTSDSGARARTERAPESDEERVGFSSIGK
jgi:hypothetical protein